MPLHSVTSFAAGDLLLVDVREPDEHRLGHLPGAVLIPRGTIEPAADLHFPKRHSELSQARKRRVVLYCGTGGRSALACDVLQEMGFENVASLAGGYAAWQEAEFEVRGRSVARRRAKGNGHHPRRQARGGDIPRSDRVFSPQ